MLYIALNPFNLTKSFNLSKR